jgi:hypothetical protein
MHAVRSPTAQGHEAMLPAPGRYRHFKGGEYVLITIARHTETDELVAVYRPSDGDTVWARPLSMFLEQVSVGDEPVPRFQPVA